MSTTLTRPGTRLRRSLAGALTTALAASTIALLPGTAQADPEPLAQATVTVSATSFSADGSHTVTVTGTGFNDPAALGTRPPFAGQQGGTYIAFGKAAPVWRPSQGAPAASRAFTGGASGGTKWAVPQAQFESAGGAEAGYVVLSPEGTFTTTITVDKAAADALTATKPTATNYGIYTYPGSGASAASYETYTPVTFTKFDRTPTISAATTSFGKSAAVTVSIPVANGTAPTGTITLSGAVAQTAALVGGAATFTLPATLGAGSKALTASYSGDANYNASSAAATLVIAKADVSVRRNKISKAPTSKKAGKTSLAVTSSTGAAVTGKVKVTFKKGNKTKSKTVTIKNGKGNVTIPKLAKGTWKITVKFNGTSNFNPTATKKAGSVKVKK